MFNPIDASKNIEEEYEDYLKTFFRMENEEYAHCFSEALKKPGAVAKGPYLEVSDSYKKGATPLELIERNELSQLFEELEGDGPDEQKEFRLKRPLYSHQEEAIEKINRGQNLVVTTGTGSGKTECFVIPIINSLLREIEAGTLDDEVRAILIYPMNALANDQIKRFRLLLGKYPQITFGVYNSSTQQTHEGGVREYGKIFRDADGNPIEPCSNEIVSRDEMQTNPPHILVTNYAMLEYMMLRPGDDKIFTDAKLHFLVLDEAHIYRGATGIETSILLKRLKARISHPENVQNILTSATLGDESCDKDILHFAETLCDASADSFSIVRSETIRTEYDVSKRDVSPKIFEALADPDPKASIDDIAKANGAENLEGKDVPEMLYNLCLGSSLYRDFREITNEPMTVSDIADAMNDCGHDIDEKDVVNITAVASQAAKNGNSLVKIRFHMFAKALEGAYVTLGKYKNVLLNRRDYVDVDEDGNALDNGDRVETFDRVKAFECAVCDDCGRIAIFGKVDGGKSKKSDEGKLLFARDEYEPDAHFYFVYNEGESALEDFERDDERESKEKPSEASKEEIGKEDYLLCTKCGRIVHAGEKDAAAYGCDESYFVKVRRVVPGKNSKSSDGVFDACPVCPNGHFRLFYPGYDAATSVLGTALFDELPEHEKVLKKKRHRVSVFGSSDDTPSETVKRNRQFITFSDSRSDAAFFASYMSAYYNEFLRRRGIVHILESDKKDGAPGSQSVADFVDRLAGYFDYNGTFDELKEGEEKDDSKSSKGKKNAWIAVLNEMVNSSGSTSLVSLGFLKFDNKINSPSRLEQIASAYNRSVEDVKALFDRLIMDIVSFGAVEGDCNYINNEDREYIYFSATKRRVKIRKDPARDSGKTQIMGWTASTYTNGHFRKNGRLQRVMDALGVGEEEANVILGDYWDDFLAKRLKGDDKEGYYLSADDFTICVTCGDVPVYRCKKCGKVTTINCEGRCPVLKCGGELEIKAPDQIQKDNHYVKLYRSDIMQPFRIKEHTAQLGREKQKDYQELFVDKRINSLSCSTTFELGVDVGDLETVYMRNMPPTPANYVQRAGRAGRGAGKAAYSLTYAKLSSHDFTFYKNPVDMISGKIKVPFFSLENEKIVQRHVFAVALSAFFKENDDVYDRDNADVLLNGNGWERFCSYLRSKPENLRDILTRSIPASMHGPMGIDSFAWTERLIGSDGILTAAVQDFRATAKYYEEGRNNAAAAIALDSSDKKAMGELKAYDGKLKSYRRSKIKKDVEESSAYKNELIDFLVRNNVLPKYGFPVDTVELHRDMSNAGGGVQLTRDLQVAVSEYAPSSEIVADGMIYTSKYIRKAPPRMNNETDTLEDRPFDTSYICLCPNPACATWNYNLIRPDEEKKCISCGEIIEPDQWDESIEPRMGFIADSETKKAGMNKPKRKYAGKFSYIGNPQMGENAVEKYDFVSNGTNIHMETSRNDSLMRVCEGDFFVCRWCGYTKSGSEFEKYMGKKKSVKEEKTHHTPWGSECGNKTLYRYNLSHEFKTDVVKIIFYTTEAKKATVLSVMYALLEAMAAELDIERDDIAGCLHPIMWNEDLIYSIILYDTVAGGAGHVRRLCPDDGGETFMKIVEKAMDITGNCTCSPSCYNCLRNYGNRDVHDLLDRFKAYDFLDRYCRKIETEPKT